MSNVKNSREMPVGLAFQLAMNEEAMEGFSNMSSEQKQQVVAKARAAKSKNEIREIVDSIAL